MRVVRAAYAAWAWRSVLLCVVGSIASGSAVQNAVAEAEAEAEVGRTSPAAAAPNAGQPAHAHAHGYASFDRTHNGGWFHREELTKPA